jgi:ABC-2 type transport system permease protein
MALFENPVLWKEMKTRVRSRQPVPVRNAIVVVVGGLILFCYYHAMSWLMSDGRADTARDGFHASVVIQSILIWLLGPALAANAVTQEKEQQTWDMLIFTLLTPFEILTGKLLSRLLPVLGILAAFLPFTLLTTAMRGATLGEFLLIYVLFAVWILFLVTVSLFMSWAFKKTATAVGMSYFVLFLLTIGTGLVAMTMALGGNADESQVLWLNPGRVVAALVDLSGSQSAQVLLFSTVVYTGATALLFWRMVSRFREFAVD